MRSHEVAPFHRGASSASLDRSAVVTGDQTLVWGFFKCSLTPSSITQTKNNTQCQSKVIKTYHFQLTFWPLTSTPSNVNIIVSVFYKQNEQIKPTKGAGFVFAFKRLVNVVENENDEIRNSCNQSGVNINTKNERWPWITAGWPFDSECMINGESLFFYFVKLFITEDNNYYVEGFLNHTSRWRNEVHYGNWLSLLCARRRSLSIPARWRNCVVCTCILRVQKESDRDGAERRVLCVDFSEGQVNQSEGDKYMGHDDSFNLLPAKRVGPCYTLVWRDRILI